MRIGRINFGPENPAKSDLDFLRLRSWQRVKGDGYTITDTTWLGLVQQALDGYAKTDGIPSDVAKLVTRLQERLLEIAG